MKNMDLMETANMMSSVSYKERFKAEYLQTKIRYEKLKAFCDKIEASEMIGAPVPVHDCPLELLRKQQKAMGEYLHVLELRSFIEEVEL